MVEIAKRAPSAFELHRAAAWWAGEGWVSGRQRKLRASFAQKEACVCEWFQQIFGGTVTTRAATVVRSEITYWYVSGPNARAFLTAIVELLPESPRRQAQIRGALSETVGRLKTGPKPSPNCQRGHLKVGGRCRICARESRAVWRSNPEVAARHREQERVRYHAKKEAQHGTQEA